MNLSGKPQDSTKYMATSQARGVPHTTYDTYFWKGPAAGGAGAPNYPIDTGLTVGFLPFAKVQGEVGFDLLLPSQDPLFRKINFAADVQTGKNVLRAWGLGSYVYFADNVSLLVGPVFFLDKNLQPGGSKYMWTAQLDIDIPLGR